MGEGLLLKYQLFQMSVDLKCRFLFERIPGQPLLCFLKILSGESYLKLQIPVVQRLDAG